VRCADGTPINRLGCKVHSGAQEHPVHAAGYEFTALKPMPYQLDGEIHSVAARTRVRVEFAPPALSAIG
jgi:diacylglycerol kinase family enzyme